VTDAFDRLAGIRLPEMLTESGLPIRDPFAQAAVDIGVRVAPDDSWSDIFSRVMAERVEPRIGNGRVTILYDYPLPEAALARPKSGEPWVAERFEMFACGLELANAFGELRDVDEQRRRFEDDMAEKARLYGERYPIDEDFLAALAVMPEASGCALGFDRLVMLLLGAPDIEDVQWTPPRDPES
jgi:elongation factor P--(R)-beta-lysine ligase